MRSKRRPVDRYVVVTLCHGANALSWPASQLVMAYHADPVQRLMTSFKFTLGFLIVMGVIMCIGAFALNTDGTSCSDVCACSACLHAPCLTVLPWSRRTTRSRARLSAGPGTPSLRSLAMVRSRTGADNEGC